MLAEVLGALQRMGLNPPPAILVKPEDALSSVRSAILLGAVVPELRGRDRDPDGRHDGTVARHGLHRGGKRSACSASVAEQLAEKKRLGLLLEEKQRLQGETETALAEEQTSVAGTRRQGQEPEGPDRLARDAGGQGAAARAAAGRPQSAGGSGRPSWPALPETNRLLASAPFSALRGQLALPVIGRITRRFGAHDDNGGVMLGDTVATQSGAIVTAPADGNVLYAGPFRSYGQLLILNAGDGYHVVLAGMSRISVALGQSVLAGEPVGAMGEARVASTSAPRNGNMFRSSM